MVCALSLRPRFFDSKAKKTCWDKAKKVPGRDPERWRIDAAGNLVCKKLHTCEGCLCFEYDHIIPFSKGGESMEDNCQILQTRVNRLKSNKNDLDQRSLNGYSCDIKFTDEQLDVIEMAVYGSVIRSGKQCIVESVDVYIQATGDQGAEMVTDQGAIYVTSNKGYNWKAAVQETVSATLNRTVSSGISGASYYTGTFSTVNRSPEGNYVAVSSRGNFYLTWEPGQPYWQPHNRSVARRIQNMGWRADGGLWLLVRGGGLYLSKGTGITEEFEEVQVQSRGFGILDVGYRSLDEAWAAGGSGILLKTTNSGKSWIRDKAADNIAANLYSVKFMNDKQGFVLGNDGVLLKYLG
ncbi:hypothetical protein RD792_011294 [Penstemon davidsonii]|uniref:Photosynthesis system II assembly factor Ycf48/Hcf136-like domain-containing protein n=1 Tax=Penstemon davidsonii TaxID=160366 RepID=A0ABR0D474_9LAMI|nr:hypothetical protein RD792_011294 [Penstemon davidsonii]